MPLCPDDEVSARLETFIIVLCSIVMAFPFVAALAAGCGSCYAASIGAPMKAILCIPFMNMLGSATMFAWNLYGAIAVVYGPDSLESCKEPSVTVRSQVSPSRHLRAGVDCCCPPSGEIG